MQSYHVIHRVLSLRLLIPTTPCDAASGMYVGPSLGCALFTYNAATGWSACSACPAADAVPMTSLAQSKTATTADACLYQKPFRRDAGSASTGSSPAAGATVRAGDPPATRAVARQVLTLVHFLAQLKRISCDKGCLEGV
jgi:hypothetical protein